LLTYQFDDYNGVVLNKQSLPASISAFSEQFHDLLLIAKQHSKQLIWFSLSIQQSGFIKLLTDAGFVFHNCLEDEITLILRLKPDAYAPFVPTYSIGAGALIFNEKNQVLVIRERLANHSGFKLPGGHIELGEKISEAIVREVYEETGIHSEFVAVQGFASKEVFRFGKSNIYFLCALKALTTEINIQDIDEIAEAKWCDVSEFINDKQNSFFTREVVKKLQHQQGLTSIELAENSGPHKKHEVFFTQNSPF
jgi:ADP-ribose pyrophosphatase YjhB (NUDIX family)